LGKKSIFTISAFFKKNINRKKLEELTIIYKNSTNIYPIGKLLNDEELVKSVKNFDLTSIELYNWIEKAAITGDKRNIQELTEIFEKLQLDYSNVLKCLDGYRVKNSS